MPTARTVSRYVSFVLVLLVLASGLSCSVKKNHKVLSFFFDGVPEPRSENRKEEGDPAAQEKNGTRRPVEEIRVVSRHDAYTQRKCRDCHNTQSLSFFKERRDRICYGCHKEEKYTGDYLHGPVAVGACNACHLPHESKYEKLLKSNAPQICIDCHSTRKKRDLEAHSKGKICTQCHNPHAGDNRFFLLQGVERQ